MKIYHELLSKWKWTIVKKLFIKHVLRIWPLCFDENWLPDIIMIKKYIDTNFRKKVHICYKFY